MISIINALLLVLVATAESAAKPAHSQVLAHSKAVPAKAEAAAAADQPSARQGRSLKQLGYDPYGIGYYDPYQAGVTPGFINVDLNRETGLHVDVGTVAVDVSPDKNYYGLGVGNLVGAGVAKDRGWNLQLGGGNILDVSVTKDAGLGLWLLNGLANINIGPDNQQWGPGSIAAQAVPGQAATPAAPGAAAAAAAAGSTSQPQVTQVVVDGAPPTSSSSSNSSSTDSTIPPVAAAAEPAEVQVASSDLAAEEPIITEEPINPELAAAAAASQAPADAVAPSAAVPAAAAAAAAAANPQAVQSGDPRSSAARRSRPATYVEPRPLVVSSGDEDVQPSTQLSREQMAPPNAYGSLAAARGPGAADVAGAPAATAAPGAAAAAAAAVPHMGASMPRGSAGLMPPAVVQQPPPQQQQQGPMVATAAAAPRRPCEGGVVVAVAGNRYKCKYRRSSTAALPAGPRPGAPVQPQG